MSVYLPITGLLIEYKQYGLQNHPNFILTFVLLQFYLISKKHKMHINVIFQTVPFTLLMLSHSFIFIFMYLREPLQYYLSSNNLPQYAQMLDFSLLTNCLCLNIISCFVQLNFSRRHDRCSHVYVPILLVLVRPNPRVAQHVVDVSRPSQTFLIYVAHNLEILFSFLICLRLSVSIVLAMFFSAPPLGLLVVKLSLAAI